MIIISSVILQIAEYTRLCKEYSDLPRNADTPEAYEPIECKRQKLKKQITTARVAIGRLKKG